MQADVLSSSEPMTKMYLYGVAAGCWPTWTDSGAVTSPAMHARVCIGQHPQLLTSTWLGNVFLSGVAHRVSHERLQREMRHTEAGTRLHRAVTR